jgi:hypothetical protein
LVIGSLLVVCFATFDLGELGDLRQRLVQRQRRRGWGLTPSAGTLSTVPPDQQIPEAPFVPLAKLFTNNIVHCNAPTTKEIPTNNHSPAKFTLGNDNWGLFLDTFTESQSKASFKDFAKYWVDYADQFALGGGAGFVAGANVWGGKLNVLKIEADGTIGSCKTHLGLQAKLFDEPIAILDILGGEDGEPAFKTATPERLAAIDPENPAIMETPPDVADACDNAYKSRNEKASALANAFYVARTARDQYLLNGTTNELCTKTNAYFDSQIDCTNTNPNVPNMWIADYFDAVDKYKETKTNSDLWSSDHVLAEAKFNLAECPLCQAE